MKLYTEEQLKNAIAMGFDWCHQKHIPSDEMINAFIEQLTPIELPTDEDVREFTIYFFNWLHNNEYKYNPKFKMYQKFMINETLFFTIEELMMEFNKTQGGGDEKQ